MGPSRNRFNLVSRKVRAKVKLEPGLPRTAAEEEETFKATGGHLASRGRDSRIGDTDYRFRLSSQCLSSYGVSVSVPGQKGPRSCTGGV